MATQITQRPPSGTGPHRICRNYKSPANRTRTGARPSPGRQQRRTTGPKRNHNNPSSPHRPGHQADPTTKGAQSLPIRSATDPHPGWKPKPAQARVRQSRWRFWAPRPASPPRMGNAPEPGLGHTPQPSHKDRQNTQIPTSDSQFNLLGYTDTCPMRVVYTIWVVYTMACPIMRGVYDDQSHFFRLQAVVKWALYTPASVYTKKPSFTMIRQ